MTHRGKHVLRTVLVLVTVLGCSSWLAESPAAAQDEAPDPINVAREAFMAAETPEARLKVITDFMAEHPRHDSIGNVVDAGTGVLLDQMDDHAGAVALAKGHLPQLQDPEQIAEIQDILITLYSYPEHAAELTGLVAQRYDVANMTYVEHLDVIKAGAKAEAWGLVNKHSAAAEPLATPAAFRAAYPDRDFSDAYIEDAGRNRQGLLKTFTGWAAANQGDQKQAQRDFKDAKKFVRENFFGLPDNELYRYWGLTELEWGHRDKGLKMLALAGIYGMDDEALTAAREAYADAGKSQADFDAFLWDLRMEHAPVMVNFTANDYQDALHEYKDLHGERATLLAFWFPT